MTVLNSSMIIINRVTRFNAHQFDIVGPTDDARALLAPHIQGLADKYDCVEIVFNDGDEHEWSNILNLPSNVHLVTCGETLFKLKSASSRFVRTVAGARNCEINGRFIWDAQDNLTQQFLEGHELDGQLSVDGSRFINTGADVSVAQPQGIVIGTADDCHIRDVQGDSIGNLVFWRGNGAGTEGSSHGIQYRTELHNPARLANVSRIGYFTDNLKIEDIVQTPYAANVLGGHCIQCLGENEAHPDPTVTNLHISNVRFSGRPGVAWEQGANVGATGDMIAIRGVRDGSLRDFYLKDGGEFGIDVIHGTEHFRVSDGCVERMDGSGVILGGSVGSIVHNCHLHQVDVVDCGRDWAGDLGFSSISGVRFLNADLCTAHGNTVQGSNGAAFYVSNSPGFSQTKIHVHSNTSCDNGTQLIGLDASWYGQTPAPGWDGTALSITTGTNAQNWTGIVDGQVSANGSGGINQTYG